MSQVILDKPQLDTLEKPTPPKSLMTFEEFLAWADEDTTHAEWVDGEIDVLRELQAL
jgi:hypothetical protein